MTKQENLDRWAQALLDGPERPFQTLVRKLSNGPVSVMLTSAVHGFPLTLEVSVEAESNISMSGTVTRYCCEFWIRSRWAANLDQKIELRSRVSIEDLLHSAYLEFRDWYLDMFEGRPVLGMPNVLKHVPFDGRITDHGVLILSGTKGIHTGFWAQDHVGNVFAMRATQEQTEAAAMVYLRSRGGIATGWPPSPEEATVATTSS